MALLFHREFVPLILSERKVETRRTWDRWKVKPGRLYQAKITTQIMTRQYFARVQVLQTFEQTLGDISHSQIHDEGFDSVESFRRAWSGIYGSFEPSLVVKVVRFRVIEIPLEYAGLWKPDPGRWSRECPGLDPLIHVSQSDLCPEGNGGT